MAHLKRNNDIQNKKRYVEYQRKKQKSDDKKDYSFDDIDKAFDEDYQLENEDLSFKINVPLKEDNIKKQKNDFLNDDLETDNLFEQHKTSKNGTNDVFNSNQGKYTKSDKKLLRNENKGQINKFKKDTKAKIKSQRKNKKGMLKTVIGIAMIFTIIFPLILWITITSAVAGSGAAIAGALVDPQQRAELKAKNEIGDSEVTKVPKDILGAEFKDADTGTNSSDNKANANSTDKKDSGNNLSAEGVGGIRKKIIDLAQSQVDKKVPYVWGGTSWDKGMDCSGFVQQTFKQVGINLPRTSEQQASFCKKIDKKDAKPGDLIFFDEHGDVGHVAIYAGNDELYEEPEPGQTCHKIKLYNMPGATTFFARPPALEQQ